MRSIKKVAALMLMLVMAMSLMCTTAFADPDNGGNAGDVQQPGQEQLEASSINSTWMKENFSISSSAITPLTQQGRAASSHFTLDKPAGGGNEEGTHYIDVDGVKVYFAN